MLALEKVRRLHGLSQRELAEKAGVSPATVYELEVGKRTTPRGSTLRKLAEALGVEVADFFIEEEFPKDTAPSRERAGGAFRRHVPFSARTAALYMPPDVLAGASRLTAFMYMVDWMRLKFSDDAEILKELEKLQELVMAHEA
jgi:transcriptional regulator with XRE-family HTH domain